MMTAEEARKITFEAKGEVAKNAIVILHERVKSNAKKGVSQTKMEIHHKVPFMSEIVSDIVEHFENLGYAVSVDELDTTVKITVSWWEE